MVIVEDIIDTGLTLNYLLRYLRGKNPQSLRICALLDKPARRLVDIDIDYRGFSIPDRFVIGYGLDYDELYRNLPFIGVLRPRSTAHRRRALSHRGRRGARRFRLPILLGSLLMIVAGFLPWWRAGGEVVDGIPVPAASGIGLEGPG